MKNRVLLGVNIDHAATLRQARYRDYAAAAGAPVEPDPVLLAQLAERAGADGITVHLREDRRHIQERDVERLRECIQTRLNLEMACSAQMEAFAVGIHPDSVCLVPENREEVTTEGGLDVARQVDRIKELTGALHDAGIRVSLFIDPDPEQIEASVRTAADWVELHTGAFANAAARGTADAEWSALCAGAEQAHAAGLIVNAGHGINYHNISRVRQLPHLHELNIGHSILSRALGTGIEEAVREMRLRIDIHSS